MQNEFLKALIQLLAQHGGTFTCPLSELQPLGLELSLQNLSSDNAATLTLRLGARIYYVPAKEATSPCPTTPTLPDSPDSRIPTSPTSQSSDATERPSSNAPTPAGRTLRSAISPEVAAVNSLNNRLPQPSPNSSPDVDELILSTVRHVPAVKSELDLYLLEQSKSTRRTAQAKAQATELRNATREYPWENRKPQ